MSTPIIIGLIYAAGYIGNLILDKALGFKINLSSFLFALLSWVSLLTYFGIGVVTWWSRITNYNK